MRFRPFAVLSVAAAAALALAGCSGATETAPTATAIADLCDAAAASGTTSDAVTVEGEFGQEPTATFTAPLDVTAVERTVTTVGSGPQVEAGDLIDYAFTVFYADSGEAAGSLGYEDGQLLPQQISPDSTLGQFFGCATVGSRIVLTNPASTSAPAAVYVLDLLGIAPTAAWGESQPQADGLPTVELAADGAPTIALPGGDAPADLQLETLKKGDGAVVDSGDTVLVQYTGVKWSDGSVFDSSWENGKPTSFVTTQVVSGFQQALEGQTVGSQVLVVIPPALGYGDKSDTNTSELAGETLVFVVDILGTQHPATS